MAELFSRRVRNSIMGSEGAVLRAGEKEPHGVRNVAGVARDVPPREPNRLPAVESEKPIATAICFEGRTAPMRAPAIDLHDDPLPMPDEVALDLLARDRHPLVDGRCRHAVAAAKGEEPPLELGLGRSMEVESEDGS